MGRVPDVDGWSASGDTYAEVVKLAEEGVPFALGHDAELANPPSVPGAIDLADELLGRLDRAVDVARDHRCVLLSQSAVGGGP